MSDIIYGDITLPDGRICKATLRGSNYPNTFWEPGYFDVDEEDPLEVVWIDNTDFTDADYEQFQDFIVDWLFEHGKFEAETYEPEDWDYLMYGPKEGLARDTY